MKWVIFLCLLVSVTGQSDQKLHTVAIIDTGLDLNDSRFKNVLCKSGHKDFTGQGIEDVHGHGTHVAGLIKQYAKNANYCIVIIKYYHNDSSTGRQNLERYLISLNYINVIKPDIVNYSGGGPNTYPQEHFTIAYNRKTKFFVAAGNDHKEISDVFPVAYSVTLKNVIGVGALDHGKKATYSNYGENLVWEEGTNIYSTLPGTKMGYMTGTSQATAIYTGKYLNEHY